MGGLWRRPVAIAPSNSGAPTVPPVVTLPVTNTAWSVAFSPDGTQIAGAILDGTLQRWTLEGEPLSTIQAHQAEVWDLAYCGQSNRLVSVSSDRTIKVWDSDGALLQTLQPPEPAAQLGVDCSDQDGFYRRQQQK